MSSHPTPWLSAPGWTHCGHGADPVDDPVGCPGIHVPGHTACLAHLADADRTAYLSRLAPGAEIDHRGTFFTEPLLHSLVRALQDPATGNPIFGDALFDGATFTGSGAWFVKATFAGRAWFDGVTFAHDAWFRGATFTKEARFRGAVFDRGAWFDAVIFGSTALFYEATFTGEAGFDEAEVTGTANFGQAIFHKTSSFGPLTCKEEVDLSGALFHVPVTMEIAARQVLCVQTRWESTASLRVRYATVDLRDAVLSFPMAVIAHPTPFVSAFGTTVDEGLLTGYDVASGVTSVRGVDAAHLVLSNLDLSRCLFSGAFHLDQLQMEGECRLAFSPRGIQQHGWLPVWWTHRRTLAEEHHWRTSQGESGWEHAPADPDWHVLGPAALAPLYRKLRKSLEEGKNEPDAADFYYGEMEMRRHDMTRPGGERRLLTAYWAMSGYGLRASRALGWLLLAIAGTVLLMMLWGLPKDDPKPQSVGDLSGGHISLTTNTPDPVNPDGPLHNRVTSKRFEKALRIVINSVVFRSSGQNLTTAGTYAEMASRVAEPVLLGLTVLAVRGRVKR